jgi:signal transduction histidine kinase
MSRPATRPAVGGGSPQTVVILDRDRLVVDAGVAVERVLGRSRADVIGSRMDLIPRVGGRGHLGSVWPDRSVHLLEYCATTTVRELTQLVALREVVLSEGLTAARDPRHAAAAELPLWGDDLDALLEHAAVRVAAALGVELVGIFEARGPRRRMVLRAGTGWIPGATGTATVSGAPNGPVARALASEDAVIITDLPHAGSPVRPTRLLHQHAVISGVELPVPGRDGPWGVLGAYARSEHGFTPDDIDFLRVITHTLALAIDHARLAEALGRAEATIERARADQSLAVVEAERRTRARITQLLHDEALQSLLAARQHLSAAAGARGPVRQAHDGVQRAIRELRGAVGALHPVSFDDQRLRDAIEAVVGRRARAGGFAVEFELEVEPGEDYAPLVLSVIRELTENVAQHAEAGEARVTLRAAGEELVLEVSDDGVGIAPGRLDAALAEGHIGLGSVARRVRAFGGALDVAPGADGGTCVRVTLPGRGDAGTLQRGDRHAAG